MKVVATLAAALLACSAATAAAQTAEPLSARVSYADLDLTSQSGRQALERRITLAVKKVCPGRPTVAELWKVKSHQACRDTAWSGARQQLAAIYDNRMLAEGSITVAGVK